MAYNKIEQTVSELLSPILKAENLSLWDLEYKKEGSDYVLRIYIDKEGGVGIDDCETVSRALEAELDRLDPIKNPYSLEVSSAGLDRALKKTEHFEQTVGMNVDVRLFAPINGEKEFTAELAPLSGDDAVFIKDGEKIVCPLDKIASVKRTVEF